MAWNQTYWDIHDQLYWSPKYLGLESFPAGMVTRDKLHILVPASEVQKNGAVYRRVGNASSLQKRLHGYEEILNHFFDLTYAIAPDDLINRTVIQPLGLADSGPFDYFRRGLAERYGWGKNGNVVQPDGVFVSHDCAIAVEMKLGAKSSDNQILKYAALLTWEEIYSGPKQEVGLLYIVPELDLPQHWDRCGLTGPKLNTEILSRTMKRKLNPTILALIEQHPDLFHSTLTRMKLHVISWTMFRESLVAARHGLDLTKRGDQTLSRLLQGILAQLAVHEGTGLLQT